MIKIPFVFRFKEPQALNTLYLDRDGVLNEAVIRGCGPGFTDSLDPTFSAVFFFTIIDNSSCLGETSIVHNLLDGVTPPSEKVRNISYDRYPF